jgi:hypothetical protein
LHHNIIQIHNNVMWTDRIMWNIIHIHLWQETQPNTTHSVKDM